MKDVLLKSFGQAGGFVVVDTMLLAESLHDGLDGREVAVVDCREEVVLDLVVEATEEEVGGVGSCEGVRGDDLVHEVVVVAGLGVLWGEVVDLRCEHEAEGVDEHGDGAPDDRLVGLKDEPRPCPQQQSCRDPTQHVTSLELNGFVGQVDRTIEDSRGERLERHDSHIQCRTQGPDDRRSD